MNIDDRPESLLAELYSKWERDASVQCSCMAHGMRYEECKERLPASCL
jgi:hypothetical protein